MARGISKRITHSAINPVKHDLTTVTRWQLFLPLVQAVNSTVPQEVFLSVFQH